MVELKPFLRRNVFSYKIMLSDRSKCNSTLTKEHKERVIRRLLVSSPLTVFIGN